MTTPTSTKPVKPRNELQSLQDVIYSRFNQKLYANEADKIWDFKSIKPLCIYIYAHRTGDTGIVVLRQRPCLKVHYSKSKKEKRNNLAVLIIEQFCTLDVTRKNVKYNHFKSGQKWFSSSFNI